MGLRRVLYLVALAVVVAALGGTGTWVGQGEAGSPAQSEVPAAERKMRVLREPARRVDRIPVDSASDERLTRTRQVGDPRFVARQHRWRSWVGFDRDGQLCQSTGVLSYADAAGGGSLTCGEAAEQLSPGAWSEEGSGLSNAMAMVVRGLVPDGFRCVVVRLRGAGALRLSVIRNAYIGDLGVRDMRQPREVVRAVRFQKRGC